MTDAEHLPNPPIVEALLDIRFSVSELVDQATILAFGDSIRAEYPTRHERSQWQGRVDMKQGGPSVTSSSTDPYGYSFTSGDGKQVIQAKPDGFSFSRLRPYESWEQLRDEARRLWEAFEPRVRPTRIDRVALRYINRLELPLPFADFKEYVLTVPEIAPTLPQGLGTFFFRVVVPEPQTESIVILTETIQEGQPDTTKLPLILDIDAFRPGVFPTNGGVVWDVFDSLRDLKNKYFFGSITDKTKELFK